MQYTHVDLSELCKKVNEEIIEAGGNEVLIVKPNGGTTSILGKDLATGIKTPLMEDVPRDVGYGFLAGYMTSMINIDSLNKFIRK